MEYIKDVRKDNKEVSVKDKTVFYSGHLTNNKRYKKIALYTLYSILSMSLILILLFPYEFGYIIGYWSSNFVKGIIFNFK